MPTLSEIARVIQAEVREIASRVDDPNRKYRHASDKAALIVTEATGAPYTEKTLNNSGCPYIIKDRHRQYADDDLIALAQNILASARKGGQRPKPRKTAA